MKSSLKYFKRVMIFLSEKLLFLQTALILLIVYFFVLGPVSLFARLATKDFLRKNPLRGKTFWQDRKVAEISLGRLKKQY